MGGDAKLRGAHVGRIWGRRDMHRWLRLKMSGCPLCVRVFCSLHSGLPLCYFVYV